jgi:hypothetical protein
MQDILAEIGPRPPGLTLDRADNNRNYEPGNMKWSTRGEQLRNRRPYKLEAMRGERSPTAKLNWNQVNAIRILVKYGSQTAVAKQFGVAQPTVRRIVEIRT